MYILMKFYPLSENYLMSVFFFLEFKLFTNSKLNEFILYTKASEIGSVFIVGVFETKNYI